MAITKDSERVRFSSTIKKDLYEKLQTYSELTDIPISKLLDRAVGQYFDEIKQQHQQGKNHAESSDN